MSKLAFVGDEKWKDEIFLFIGKPMRKTAIEFFLQDQSTRLRPGYLKKTFRLRRCESFTKKEKDGMEKNIKINLYDWNAMLKIALAKWV